MLQPILLARFPEKADGIQDDVLHVRQGKLLRQCSCGDLLQEPEGRNALATVLCRGRSTSMSGRRAHINVLLPYPLLPTFVGGPVESGANDELSRRLIDGDCRFLDIVQYVQLVLQFLGHSLS